MMMKKYGLITKVLLISMFAILLNGCENSLTSEFSSKANEAKFYTITGNIDVDAISAENSSRTGLPTIPSINDNSINFSVSAKMGDETIDGKVDGNQYSITLPKGSWTITVIGKKAEVKVLEGSINVNPEEPTTQQTITLKIIKAGTGSLSLTISKEATLSCGGVKATLYKNSGEESNDVKYLKFNDTDNNLIQLGFNDLPAGTYSIDLEFYQEMTSLTTTEGTYSCKNLLYSHHDTVNIFANLVTNTWTGSGYSEDKTTFTLTQAMIDNFAMTTFYVSNSGDDSKAGTYFAPFATLQAAVDKVNSINDGTSSYTIYVKDEIKGSDNDFTDENKALINVVPKESKSLNLKICGYNNQNVTIDAQQKGRVMYIGENANVTLQNLILTGGYLSDTKGGGIYSEGTCSLSSCTISENTADEGGGVYVKDGTFTMENNSLISKNTSGGNGGGIFAEGGNITINGGSISENIFENGYSGGGIYLTNSATLEMSDGEISGNCLQNTAPSDGTNGGGVMVSEATFTMTGGEISDNSAYSGGGVFVSGGKFSMSGGKISSNICTYNGKGVSVYNLKIEETVKNATFEMSGGAYVNSNNDVYLANGTTITVTGNLTGTTPVATITPDEYSATRQVLVAESTDGATSSVTLSEQVGKFEVTPQVLSSGGYEYWYVTADGMLAKDSIIYVDSTFSGSSDGTKDYPFITIQEAVNSAILKNTDGSTKIKILLQSNVEDTSTGSYDSTNNSSFVNINPSDDKQDLTLEIASYGEDSFAINANKSGENSGRVMYIGQKANVTLRNINISGGNLKDDNGGAIYCSGTLNLVNSTISESNAKNGGGIYIENGTFTMNGGIIGKKIPEDDDTKYSWEYAATTTGGSHYSNFASSAGGGIYAENATVNIISGKVSYNYAINYESAGNFGIGGGIFMKNGTLTIGEGVEVSYNSGYQGAGIRCESETLGKGTCTIKEGAIIKGNATHIYNKTNYGGGIFVKDSNFIMEGGTIEENYAGDGGAGIYFENVSPTIKKGNIRNNKYGTEADAHKFGSEILLFDNAKLSISSSNVVIESLEDETRGIYVRNSGSQSELALSDSAYIKSPVYLDANANIKITGALTTPEEANGIIATITPNEYSISRQVLVAESTDGATSSVTLSEQVGKFEVTPQVLSDGNEYWFVDLYGYLGKVPKTEDNDDGTVVYLMESYDNLLWIAQELKTRSITSFNMKLTNNIVIPSGKWQFSQLDVTNPSTIDGQGHSITINEDVSSFGNNAGGLFYKFNNSTVKNLVLKGSITANTSGKGYIGALCRSAYRTTIQNVMSTVEIIDEGSGNAGGLVGYFGGHNGDKYTPDTFIKNCAVYADISSENGTAGGLVGESWENTQTWKIENCIYMGAVSSETGVAGALIGNENTGRISYLTDIWYCESNNCAIFGKEGNAGNIEQSGVESKNDSEIATAEAAKLLGDAWEYVSDSKYPTLKKL